MKRTLAFSPSRPVWSLTRVCALSAWFLASSLVLMAETPRPEAGAASGGGLTMGTFDVDATPPVGSMMAYDPVTNRWDLGLRARGVILAGSGKPIVLCAVDWIGIGNGGQDVFKAAIANAAETIPERVAIHALHQHDAPDCDFSAEHLLRSEGLDPRQYEGTFQREVVSALASAVRRGVALAVPVTHVGLGVAPVHEVASNRRILGPDGKVRETRWTATKDPAVRAEPEGLIDPVVSLVSFWNDGKPIAALSYYATHPQSYYRLGMPSPDFPGLARFLRQLAIPEVLHVHFNGAGGNIGAGKYNDGSPGNRVVLAQRLADGMKRAWENTKKEPLSPSQVDWKVERVALPLPGHLTAEKLEAQMKAREASFFIAGGAAKLSWVRRVKAGHRSEVACLSLGTARVFHMPGELFVEYQLAAKALRPEDFVAMAGYGDYAPGYIGTAIAYEQGGYETSPSASNVAPEVEKVLMGAIKALLAK